MNEDDFTEDIHKLFDKMSKEMARIMKERLESGDLDETLFKHGFKVELGPDGPKFEPMNEDELDEIENMAQEKGFHTFRTSSKFKKSKIRNPLTDVFSSEEGYQVIADVRGVMTEQVQITFKNAYKINIHAKSEEEHYSKSLTFKRKLNQEKMNYIVRNGVLEINLFVQ